MLPLPFILTLASLIACVLGSPLHKFSRQADAISVELTQAGPGQVKAKVSNDKAEPIRLFVLGTFLDDFPVQSFTVSQNGTQAKYMGLTATYLIKNLSDGSFLTLQPGESAEKIVSIPAFYSLNAGVYDAHIANTFSFASQDSNSLEGFYEYTSNILTLDIDSSTIVSTARAVPATTQDVGASMMVKNECTDPNQKAKLNYALEKGQQLAIAASYSAALDRSPRYTLLFRTMDFEIRRKITHRLRLIGNEADARPGDSKTTWYCDDFNNDCLPDVLAYTVVEDSKVALCPPFWNLPVEVPACFERSQAGTVVHELSHSPRLMQPATIDHAYGISDCLKLSPEKAWMNADTYALYAETLALNCDVTKA